jgi:hypothetical protein
MGDLRWMGKAAGRGAYAIRALPDLCVGIVLERLGHLDPFRGDRKVAKQIRTRAF